MNESGVEIPFHLREDFLAMLEGSAQEDIDYEQDQEDDDPEEDEEDDSGAQQQPEPSYDTSDITQYIHPTVSSDSIQLQYDNVKLQESLIHLADVNRESEMKLTHMQEACAQLRLEFQQETQQLQVQLEELQTTLKELASEKAEMQARLRDQDTLQTYLNTLPSAEEHEKLKAKLELQTEEKKKLSNKFGLITAQLAKTKQAVHVEKSNNLKFEHEIHQLKLELQESHEIIQAHERRQLRASMMDTADYESLLKERDQLQEDKEQLESQISDLEAQHQIDTQSAQQLKEQLDEAQNELDTVREKLDEEISTNSFLRKDLTKEKFRCSTHSKRICQLSSELRNYQQAEEAGQKAEKHQVELARELEGCLEDMKDLCSVTEALMTGTDPDVSLLLGLKKGSGYNSGSDSKQSMDAQKDKLVQIRKNIKDIRESLSQKYAESIADNKSCITQ